MNPYLKTLLLRQIILNLVTLPIPVILVIRVVRRKHGTPETAIFIRMCILNAGLCLSLMSACALLIGYDRISEPVAVILDYIMSVLIGVLPLALVALWLLFVEYTLHHSLDIIRRRYPVVMIPFFAGVVITVLSSLIPVPDSAPMIIINAAYILYRAELVIWSFYILASYVVMYREKKRNRIPQYIKLTPTVLPIAAGMILSALTAYQLDGLGFAVGLLFADYYMFRRLSFIDPKTGLFNRKYLSSLMRFARKNRLQGATLRCTQAMKPTMVLRWMNYWGNIPESGDRMYLRTEIR